MNIEIIKGTFSICKVKDLSKVNINDKFVFISKTDEEISLVCSCNSVPENVICEDKDWCCFRIGGILDFSLIGILYNVSKILAENEIGIFVVSTYNTDYILVKSENMTKAVTVFEENGINISYLE